MPDARLQRTREVYCQHFPVRAGLYVAGNDSGPVYLCRRCGKTFRDIDLPPYWRGAFGMDECPSSLKSA